MAGVLTKVGRYQIIGELGRGSMGVVYRAFDPVIGRAVAIKTMLTEELSGSEFQQYKARFEREAKAAGILSHPNIVTVYDFGEENNVLYLAMEYLEGESLEKVMERENNLPIETIVPMFEQVCSALDHAHSRKIVHRDIKPANIMILVNGLVKVTDFGIAKTATAGMTQAGQILGTPNYMSPEQVKGRPVDGRSDIFSLGVILYELITGEKPFVGQNLTTVIYKIVNEDPIAPRELDSAIHPGLSYITSKALAKSPDQRYPTCRRLAEDLRNYKNLGVSPGPTSTLVLKAPQPSAPVPKPLVEKTLRVDSPLTKAVEVPPEQPRAGSTSVVTWALLFLLLIVALGAGYYFYQVGGPLKALDNLLPAPAPLPPAAKAGGLTITANVPGASISIDGQSDPGWITPHTFSDLSPGPHVVGASKDGYDETQQTVIVKEGRTYPLNAVLAAKLESEKSRVAPPSPLRPVPVPKVGQLVVTSNVEGARISLDNRTAPDWVTPHTFAELPVGSHALAVAKVGYDTEYRSVTVQGGRTKPINVDLAVPSGTIRIVTNPPGAEVVIDGRLVGTSPVQVPARVGVHTYAARLAGEQPLEGTIEARKGVISVKTVTWPDAVSSLGIVEIRTVPPGATVSDNGSRLSDKTPALYRLTAGRHKLTLSLAGFEVVEREVDVPANNSIPITVYVDLSRP
jgi:serine/threonine-protein kinase